MNIPSPVGPARSTAPDGRAAQARRPIPVRDLQAIFRPRTPITPTTYERRLAERRHVVIEPSRNPGPLIVFWAMVSWAVLLGCVWLIVSGTL